MATMLEVFFFPPDCCDYRAVDMGHPCFHSLSNLFGTCLEALAHAPLKKIVKRQK